MNSNTIASNGIEKKKAKLLGASNEDGFIQ